MSSRKQALLRVAERLTPVNNTSSFTNKGTLTPAEFLEAGNAFVHACPTWHWEGGEAGRARDFLPADKQVRECAVWRGVVCSSGVGGVVREAEEGRRDRACDGTLTGHHNGSSSRQRTYRAAGEWRRLARRRRRRGRARARTRTGV